MTDGFDYFRFARDRYVPFTARAALRALEDELLPPEAFLFLGTSVRPLDEEPVSLAEIERILSRKDLDLDTNLLLMRVLRRLLASADPEVALFAAESISRIESRYIDRIESLKRRTAGVGAPQAAGSRTASLEAAKRRLAEAYYQLAQIHPAAIRAFYLREAFGCIKELQKARALRRRDVRLLVRILLDLRLPGQALGILRRLKGPKGSQFLLLEAEVEFQRRNLPRVREICLLITEQGAPRDEETARVLDLWKGA